MKKSVLHIVALLFLAINCGAGNIDETLLKFNKQQSPSAANDFFAALLKDEFIDEQVTFNKTTNADTIAQQVWYWAAEWYTDAGQYRLAEKYALKALPLCQMGNNRMIESDCLNVLAIIYTRLSDYPKAAKYAHQCYLLDKAGGDHDMISSSLNTLAAIYMSARQLDDAERFTLMAIEEGKKADNPRRMAILLGRANEVYHYKGEEEKSLDYGRQALAIENKIGNKSGAAIR